MSKSRIIVLGGSFNPPTIAHLKLMQAAIEQLSDHGTVSDVRGVFVPSSDAYVRRKMTKKPDTEDHSVLSEKLRYDMLDSFREIDSRLQVDGRELGTTNVKGHTVDTLNAIQQENPDAEVFFIFGGDKLEGLPHWNSYEALVSRFRVILFERGDQDAKSSYGRNLNWQNMRMFFLSCQSPMDWKGSVQQLSVKKCGVVSWQMPC